MIPWFQSTTYQIGPVTLQTWGTLVAIGFFVSTWLIAKRAQSKHLDPNAIWDMSFWVFVAGFLGARLFHVLFYAPAYYLQHPLEAIDLRQPGYALMGGLLAGAAAFILLIRRRRLPFWDYADVTAWGLPWGCGIGRIGCFLIHDHPGTLTSFVLGVKYPDGQVRHDLGLDLALLGFGIGILLALLGRKQRRAGFFLGMFLVFDGVGRFLLDFLRLDDRRISGLTPTQWLLLATTAIGVWLLWGRPKPVQP